MKKLNGPSKQRSAKGRHKKSGARVLAIRLYLAFLLMFGLTSVFAFCANDALAQGAVNTGKNGQGSTPQTDADASAPGDRTRYFQRFPFAAAANKYDKQHTDQSTNQNASDSGNQHQWQAYAPVVKMCDTCNHIEYKQIPMQGQGKPAAARDDELFDNLLTTYGLPLSDSQFQIIQRENNQRMLELAYDPERVSWMTSATSQTTASASSKAMANTGEIALNAVFNRIVNGDGNGSMINVANEGSVAGLSYRGAGDDASIAGAVYMVQTMYKQVFVPMAILFLLPGAVLSQVKSVVGKGFNLQTPESQSPFDGILRSIVAVFLIPATQVIMSWSIDTGNSLAYSCRDYVSLPLIMNWTQQLCYDPKKTDNAIQPPAPQGGQSGGGGNGLAAAGAQIGGQIAGSIGAAIGSFLGGMLGDAIGGYGGIGSGLALNQPEAQAVIEQQDWMGQALQSTLNGAMLMASIMLIVLTALQVVLACYMLLLGPISAAFYAWPQVGEGFMFRGVFGRWVEGVIKVSMWRFIWMVVLAIMTQRIIYMGGMPTDLRWEVAVFICFLGLMIGVPSSPFTFMPYQAFGSAVQLQNMSSQNSGSSGGGTAPQQGSMGSPSNNTPNMGNQGAGSPGGGDTSQGAQTPSASGQGTEGQQSQQPQNGQSPSQGQDPSKSGDSKGQDQGAQPAPPPSDKGKGGDGAGQDGKGGDGKSGDAKGGENGAPPMSGGGAGGGASGGSGGGAGGAAGGGAGGGAQSGGSSQGGSKSDSSNSNSQAMPSGSPATPLSPPAGASKDSPSKSVNGGAPAAPPAAAAGAPPADGGGDDKGDDKKSDKKGAPPAAHGGGAPSGGGLGGIAGQVAAAAQSAPPPSKKDGDK